MKLSAPKQATWIVAVVLGALSLLGSLTYIAVITPYSYWLAIVGLGALILGTLLEDL